MTLPSNCVWGELATNPGHSQLRLISAHAMLGQGRKESARREALQVLKLDPRNVEAYRILGDVAWRSGDPIRAKTHLETIVQLESNG